ncbi:hypothetical protein BLNAU_9942 [Blattamonas nauphoetae]|uniref:Uncharacterized protein n=1 Tax=Blattamonas nauphoetae TaxID=2049346 RepID=A0ABQ9XU58_9EUKA|nr:hypothetical protein BLNAU_9942 [Blattamonas nauphoetae]
MTARTAGDSGVPDESNAAEDAVEAETDGERAVESDGEMRMTEIRMKIAASSRAARSDLSSQASFSMDTSPFLNWNEENLESEEEKAIVFRSLVATLKLQHVLDVSLEAKAVRFLKSVDRQQTASANAFLSSLISICDDSPTDFKHYIVVLISSTSQAIIKASVEMLERLILWCSAQVRLTLVKADLIPHLINTLNMQALSFTESVDIHINVIKIIRRFLWLATAGAQADLEIEDDDEQQAVQKTIFRQVLVPSEQYLCHLCVNQFLFVDEDQSKFLDLIAQLLEISPYYQPTMEVVLNMPSHILLLPRRHSPTPLCLSLTTLSVVHADVCSFEPQAMLSLIVSSFPNPDSTPN